MTRTTVKTATYRASSGNHNGQTCGLCDKPATGIDHCHKHGTERGPLCNSHNLAMRPVDARYSGTYSQALLDWWGSCPRCAAKGPWQPTGPKPPRSLVKSSYAAPPEVISAVQRWREQHPGRPVADLIRAGLASYGRAAEVDDPHAERLRAIEQALTALHQQLAEITQTLATLPETRVSAEQIEQHGHDWLAERVTIWHRELCAAAPNDLVFTARTAMLAGDWSSSTTARQRLDLLTSHGLATEVERADTRGNPRQWRINPPAEVDRGLPKR